MELCPQLAVPLAVLEMGDARAALTPVAAVAGLALPQHLTAAALELPLIQSSFTGPLQGGCAHFGH